MGEPSTHQKYDQKKKRKGAVITVAGHTNRPGVEVAVASQTPRGRLANLDACFY